MNGAMMAMRKKRMEGYAGNAGESEMSGNAGEESHDMDMSAYDKKLDAINSKLDQVLELLGANEEESEEVKPEIPA